MPWRLRPADETGCSIVYLYSLSRIRLRYANEKLRENGCAKDVLVDILDLLGLERWSSNNQGVKNNPDRPNVYLEGMAVRGIKQNLWRNIIRRSAYCLLPLSRVFDECREPEIPHFDVHIPIQEQITQFEIAMNDLVRVHVVAGSYKLEHEEPCFGLCEAPSTTKHIHERPRRAEFQRHIDIVFVLEAVQDVNDVWVVEELVNLDFCVQLLDD